MPFKSYEQKAVYNAAFSREQSRGGREIGDDFPEVANPRMKAACRNDLRRFLTHYFPNAFNLKWAPDHITVIQRLQQVMELGGLFALAMPRGSGKTTISVRAAIWSLLYGYRRFVCLVGATEQHATNILKHIKHELIFNEALGGDFPEVCYALQRLENNARRCVGQLFEGEQTRIEWSQDRVTFPTMPEWTYRGGPNVSGSTVTVAGITGALRGQSHTLPNGVIIRPEVVILDDPQTRESAKSPSQSEDRAAIIRGDVLGMAGPGSDIAAVMPCTVIRPDDLASVMLDREKSPEWSGQKTKMLYSFPTDMKLWGEYNQIRNDSFKADKDGSEATQFYKAHRKEMDAGANVAWPQRFSKKAELSAVQHAMNLFYFDKPAFFAEYQNEPLTEEIGSELKASEIIRKVNRYQRRSVPLACSHLTAFIDVQDQLLFYCVVAWADDFAGYVVDYDAFPDQKRAYFTNHDAQVKLETVIPAAGREGRLYGGLDTLTKQLLGREWPRDDGTGMRIDLCLIDANWGESTPTVDQFAKQSQFAAQIKPSHGKYFGASSVPMRDYARRPGEKRGLNWLVPTLKPGRLVRHVVYDTNYWKSFIYARLAVAMGDHGCLSLWGDDPERHRMFSDHLTAEYRVRTSGRGREVDEWKPKPNRDNHWLDCLTGCAVAASMLGVTLAEASSAKPVSGERKPMRISEMAAAKRNKRAS